MVGITKAWTQVLFHFPSNLSNFISKSFDIQQVRILKTALVFPWLKEKKKKTRKLILENSQGPAVSKSAET